MNMSKRLDKLETQLNTHAKYKDCELEIVVGVDGEPSRYYCRFPDGHEELLTDRKIISELAAVDNKISVEIID